MPLNSTGSSRGPEFNPASFRTGHTVSQKDGNLLLQFPAALGPVFGGAEPLHPIVCFREGNRRSAQISEFLQPGVEELEKAEFKTLACLAGQIIQRQAKRWWGQRDPVTDLSESDFFEGGADFFGEFLESDGGALEPLAQVDHEATDDVGGEPPVALPGRTGGIPDVFLQPVLAIGGDFIAADAEKRKLGGQGNHGAER